MEVLNTSDVETEAHHTTQLRKGEKKQAAKRWEEKQIVRLV